MVGYSGTPLPRKLGVKPGHRVLVLRAPEAFVQHALAGLPEGVAVRRRARGSADVIVAFHGGGRSWRARCRGCAC